MNADVQISDLDVGEKISKFRPILPFFGQKNMMQNIVIWALKRCVMTRQIK